MRKHPPISANADVSSLARDTGLDQLKNLRKIVNIFLPIVFNVCFGCSKEPSHRDGSFEYQQHMFWLRNKKIIFLLRTLYIFFLQRTLN